MKMKHHAHKRRRHRLIWIAASSLLVVGVLTVAVAVYLSTRDLLNVVQTPSTCREKPTAAAASEEPEPTEGTEQNAGPYTDPATGNLLRQCVPLILQNEEPDPLPTGCESASAAMLLQTYGYDYSKNDVANALPKGFITTVGGTPYGPDPNEMFVGDPSKSGLDFGVYSKPMGVTMQKLIDMAGRRHTVRLLTGGTRADILEQLDKGRPVLIWVTMGLSETKPGYQWNLIKNGVYTDEVYTWKAGEHCVVMTGYWENTVSINDPLKGQWVPDMDLFFTRWEEQGKHALILE